MEDFGEILKGRVGQETKDWAEAQPVEVVAAQPLNAAPIKASIAKYEKKVKEMLAKAEKLEIKTDAAESGAITLAGNLGSMHKELENIRTEAVKIPNAYVKEINNAAKKLTEPIKRMQGIIKQKLQQHIAKKTLARRQAQAIIEEKTKQLQEELNAEAEKSGVKAPQAAPIVIPKDENVTRGTDGSSFYTRAKWTVEVEDEKKVPREYCTPNQQLLDKAAEMGIREIPGCKVYEKHIPVLKGA